MYEHHRQSIENLLDYFKDDQQITAIVLGGSVAKGCAREDSDIDAILVVPESRYACLERENRLTECVYGHCTYEKGYFDLKYCTKAYLKALAREGSEPSRNAFLSAQCLFSKDPEIEELVSSIPVFQKAEQQEKMLSFYAAFRLNSGYFWRVSGDNPYLRARVTADMVLFGLWLLLEENEVLYPCHKALLQTVAALKNRPEQLVDDAVLFLQNPTEENKTRFEQRVLGALVFQPPADYSEVLTRYTDDNELWWYKHRPCIAEW